MTIAATAADTTVQTVTYATLFGGVLVGAIVPVIPTGALVSAAAASALYSEHPITALLVVAVGAIAALLGDMALFSICSLPVGDRLLAWLRRRAGPDLLERSHRQLDNHGIRVLILSRLIPGGRIPIMAAALILKLSWRWYLAGDSVAALAWSVIYAAIGVLSGSIFDEQWKGIALAITLVVLVSVGPALWKRLRHHSTAKSQQSVSAPVDAAE
ncbi:membrane protein DedA with SNARE-associated domain [Nakamurella sp. UYEF19]|uniref:DedA family protein n=1 Tax=Nakamurella sp. UYEF19 TaxID=1756392 RepID=UPI0033909CA8